MRNPKPIRLEIAPPPNPNCLDKFLSPSAIQHNTLIFVSWSMTAFVVLEKMSLQIFRLKDTERTGLRTSHIDRIQMM